ncbi:hypothetical protein HDU85_006674 [Gaertneriomyces sp. JEL0708]|nr:hypothetical protein HDU85_006674 [Gaertneriomyces sp. JEL0708]
MPPIAVAHHIPRIHISLPSSSSSSPPSPPPSSSSSLPPENTNKNIHSIKKRASLAARPRSPNLSVVTMPLEGQTNSHDWPLVVDMQETVDKDVNDVDDKNDEKDDNTTTTTTRVTTTPPLARSASASSSSLLIPRRHLQESISPAPSPLTPQIEALMYRLELVDTAGCGGLEAVDELCERDTSDTDTSDRKSETRSESPTHSTTLKGTSPTSTVTPATSSPPTAAPIHHRPRTRSTSHAELAKTAVGLREIAKKIGRAQLIWDAPPRTVLIVTKAHEPGLVRVTKNVTKWLANALHLKVIVEDRMRDDPVFEYDDLVASVHDLVDFWTLESVTSIASVIDFVITLGGDGTVLYAAWMFQQKCPPILPFRLGSLGFLTTFDFRQFRESVCGLLSDGGVVLPDMDQDMIPQGVNSDSRGMRMNFRMRFSCTIIRHHQEPLHLVNGDGTAHGIDNSASHHTTTTTTTEETYHILNDLTIDRGPSPYMSSLELYGNSHLLTTLASDGLVISTPTGSTAYSLSAGGSLVHPDVSAILVTPICPHTLSFRPMVLPDTMELCVAVPCDSRTTAWASLDGRLRVQLNKGDRIVVRAGVWPVPTVCWEDQSRDWFKGLERCLGWGRRERQKAFGEEQGDVWKW